MNNTLIFPIIFSLCLMVYGYPYNAINYDLKRADERININFLKVLMSFLILDGPLPTEIDYSIQILIHGLIGTKKYHHATGQILSVAYDPLENQISTMLRFIEKWAEDDYEERKMKIAAKTLRTYIDTPEARESMRNIGNYVRNLFQTVVAIDNPLYSPKPVGSLPSGDILNSIFPKLGK